MANASLNQPFEIAMMIAVRKKPPQHNNSKIITSISGHKSIQQSSQFEQSLQHLQLFIFNPPIIHHQYLLERVEHFHLEMEHLHPVLQLVLIQ